MDLSCFYFNKIKNLRQNKKSLFMDFYWDRIFIAVGSCLFFLVAKGLWYCAFGLERVVSDIYPRFDYFGGGGGSESILFNSGASKKIAS